MSALRLALRPALRTTTKLRPITARRFLSADSPSLYAAHASVTGARNGHIESEGLTLDLAMPPALGGPSTKGKTNPEELFAAGYGACFRTLNPFPFCLRVLYKVPGYWI